MNTLEWIGLFTFLCTAYAPLFSSWTWNQNKKFMNWYSNVRKNLLLIPPTWVFPPVWGVLYLFMALSIFWYWKDGQLLSHYDTVLYVYGVNLLLNKMFTPLIFLSSYSDVIGKIFQVFSVITVLGILGTGGYILAQFSIEGFVASAVLFAIYLAWCLYALFLSLQILFFSSEEKRSKDDDDVYETFN